MSMLPAFTGQGFFAGEAPDGLTTVISTPQTAEVRVYWRDPDDAEAEDVFVASTQSAADGTWRIENLNPDLQYVVRGRKAGFDDVTVVGVRPSRADVLTIQNLLQPNGEFNGMDGNALIDSGLPPFTVTVIEPLPYGLQPVIDGRKLIIEGTSEDEGDWSSVVRVTASNGVFEDVPLRILILDAPAIFWAAHGAACLETFSAQLTLHPLLNVGGRIKWSITSGKLPLGLHLDPQTGAISGVANDEAGYYPFTVRCDAAAGGFWIRACEIAVLNYAVLLPLNAPAGSTAIEDKTGRAWTRSGSPVFSDATAKFGESSLSLGTNTNWFFQTANHADFALGTKDFTMSAWVYTTSKSANFRGILGKRSAATSTASFAWMTSGTTTGKLMFQTSTNGSDSTGPRVDETGHLQDFPANEWVHVAIARKGSLIRMFRDGEITGEASSTASIFNSSAPLQLGKASNSGTDTACWNGYMQEVSIQKGAARFWDAFMPPQAQSDFPQPAPAIAINGSLPAAIVGQPYVSTGDVQIHGAGPFNVSVTDGALPDGWSISVNGVNVEVSGPAAVIGTYFFMLTASDATNAASLPLTLRVV